MQRAETALRLKLRKGNDADAGRSSVYAQIRYKILFACTFAPVLLVVQDGIVDYWLYNVLGATRIGYILGEHDNCDLVTR